MSHKYYHPLQLTSLFGSCTKRIMVSMTPLFLAAVLLPAIVMGETCFCPMDYSPVCGSNGMTFSNMCQLNCYNMNHPSAHIQLAGWDKCEQRVKRSAVSSISRAACLRFCPHTPIPVCGSDGVTYGSACALDCIRKTSNAKAGVTVVHDGYCKKINV